MREARLARSEVRVTELGLGTAQLGDLFVPIDQMTADAIVDAAFQEGIRYFDTAPHYGLGLAETRLGIALSDRPRDEYRVSTKVGRLLVEGAGGRERRWDFSGDGVRRSLDSSCLRLGLDRVDIALVHDPEDHLAIAVGEAFPALEELRRGGAVGAIGVGSRDLPSLVRFARETDVDVLMVAGRLTLLDASALDELVPLCRARGIALLVAGVFNSGVLATVEPSPAVHYEYATVPPEVLARVEELRAQAAARGEALPAAALAFARSIEGVASIVVGADSADQLRATAEHFRRSDPEGAPS